MINSAPDIWLPVAPRNSAPMPETAVRPNPSVAGRFRPLKSCVTAIWGTGKMSVPEVVENALPVALVVLQIDHQHIERCAESELCTVEPAERCWIPEDA
jgi:hypothetical protein